jgi:hypothetical protein
MGKNISFTVFQTCIDAYFPIAIDTEEWRFRTISNNSIPHSYKKAKPRFDRGFEDL